LSVVSPVHVELVLPFLLTLFRVVGFSSSPFVCFSGSSSLLFSEDLYVVLRSSFLSMKRIELSLRGLYTARLQGVGIPFCVPVLVVFDPSRREPTRVL